MNLKELKQRLQRWADNRRLIKAKKLIMHVYQKELPGTILLIDGQQMIVTDIVFSLRKNEVKATRSKVKNRFTRRQQSAINFHIKHVKRSAEVN